MPRQFILDEFAFKLEHFTYNEKKLNEIIKSFIRPFDLSKAPLCRVGIVEKSTDEHLIMIDIHHIITDVASTVIFISELIKLYNREELPTLNIQYKDYSDWLEGEEQQKQKAKQKSFWLNNFAEEATVLDLPIDFPRPLMKSYEGNQVNFEIGQKDTRELKAITEREGVSLFMVLLSIYNILLSKLSNQEDIIIGTVTAGRQHADLENIIGMFVNTLPLRNYPKGELSFKEFLSTLKARTLACFDNQAFPYEELIDELHVTRDTSRNPLFDVMLVFQNQELSEFTLSELTIKPFNNIGPGLSSLILP